MKRVFFAVALLLLASVSSAVTVGLMPTTVARFWNSTGTAVLSGGYVVTCPSGASCGCTSFTAKTSYTDSTGLVANANPVYLNSRGEASIWLDTSSGAYKITTCDRFGVLQTTTDGVIAIQQITSPQSVNIWQATGLTPTFLSTVSFSVLGDYTTTFTPGRRLKIVEGAGTVYSSVSSTGSSYAAGVTTIYTTNDVSPLDVGISSVAINLVDNKTGISSNIPGTLVQRDSTGAVSGLYLTSGATVSNGTLTVTANIFSSGINSWSGSNSFATGTGVAPFTVPTSTTVVTNLNSDMLDGFHSSSTPTVGQIPALTAGGDLLLPFALTMNNNQRLYMKDSTGSPRATLFRDSSNRVYMGDIERGYTGLMYLSGAGDHALWFTNQAGNDREIWHSGNVGTAGMKMYWASVTAAGALELGVGALSSARTTTGSYTVNFPNMTSTTSYIPVATANGAGGAEIVVSRTSTTQVTVTTSNSGGTASDTAFFLFLIGI